MNSPAPAVPCLAPPHYGCVLKDPQSIPLKVCASTQTSKVKGAKAGSEVAVKLCLPHPAMHKNEKMTQRRPRVLASCAQSRLDLQLLVCALPEQGLWRREVSCMWLSENIPRYTQEMPGRLLSLRSRGKNRDAAAGSLSHSQLRRPV
jgi:hypothetical protein